MEPENILGWRAELLFLNAFPAPVQVFVGDMVARLGGGVARRTCSASPLRGQIGDLQGTVDACERLYADRGLTTRFRVPDPVDPALDRLLASRGYAVECDVRTLLAPALAPEGTLDPAITLLPHPDAAWLAAQDRLKDLSPARSADYRASLAAIGLPSLFAALWEDGAITALCFGGIHQGLLAVEGVVTDPALRNGGRSRRVVGAMMARARTLGAEAATLQVEAENAPALALYTRLGFTQDLHRYHYRRKDLGPSPSP
ncbi:GNAT family N-acetyltransferase [Rhodospirillum sp. A1_3_36]|uniref:GNAT family N-acetyltransferase n=1 Tax=Rhodospirillum sp. A1_3_36 TaxID=3391666 RepID=UPI0039A60EB8